jgi:ankyrin repeat protein
VDILVDSDGNTALYYLMQKIPQPREMCLYWQVLSLFVRRGLDVNFPNEKGETPLHEAAFRSNLPALQFLVASSADLTLQTKYVRSLVQYLNMQ